MAHQIRAWHINIIRTKIQLHLQSGDDVRVRSSCNCTTASWEVLQELLVFVMRSQCRARQVHRSLLNSICYHYGQVIDQKICGNKSLCFGPLNRKKKQCVCWMRAWACVSKCWSKPMPHQLPNIVHLISLLVSWENFEIKYHSKNWPWWTHRSRGKVLFFSPSAYCKQWRKYNQTISTLLQF